MGIFFNRSSYYNYLKKAIKIEYDKNQTSEFNKIYSLKKIKFIKNRKLPKYSKINAVEFSDWKSYLLSKLYTDSVDSWRYFSTESHEVCRGGL